MKWKFMPELTVSRLMKWQYRKRIGLCHLRLQTMAMPECSRSLSMLKGSSYQNLPQGQRGDECLFRVGICHASPQYPRICSVGNFNSAITGRSCSALRLMVAA